MEGKVNSRIEQRYGIYPPHKPKKKRTLLKIAGCVLILGLLLVVGTGLFVWNALRPVVANGDDFIKVEIPMDSSLKEISTMLDDKNVVRDGNVFYYYVRYKGESGFQAGTYYFKPGTEPQNIMTQLKEGRIYADSDKLTIPEGFTVEQIAQRISDKGIGDKEKFLQLAKQKNFAGATIQNEIPDNQNVKYTLEGFLFPETYIIHKDTTEEQIIELMLNQTDKVIPEEWYAQLKVNQMSLYETINLAAIIEREARDDSERKKIAGVYYNRLKQGMRLQADATIQYALGAQKDRLLYKDLEIDSPYNTYKKEGLPPGPIANPGLPSIEAAFFPEKHNYLFYVMKKDGSGHNFSETYEQHLKFVDEAK